jgi:tripeptide aminopeptidase
MLQPVRYRFWNLGRLRAFGRLGLRTTIVRLSLPPQDRTAAVDWLSLDCRIFMASRSPSTTKKPRSKARPRTLPSAAPTHGDTNGSPQAKADVVASAPPEPNLERALDLCMQLMRVPGPSCQEGAIVKFIREKLLSADVPAEAIRTDDAHLRSPAGGEVGNLIVNLPGTFRGPRRLLMAHLDTVPLCVGCVPEVRGEWLESANPQTGLGADNRSGVATVLTAALEIFEQKLPHPPLTFFWPVQEELGIFGSRYVRPALLGKPRLAFNWDARGPQRITLAATGGYAIKIIIRGIASHAGGSPECGVSAIGIAGLAIHELVTGGWHGDIQRGKLHGTSNLGIIKGGDAVNVVTDQVEILAEVRSYDSRFRAKIAKTIERAFRKAAKAIRNDEGKCGKIEFISDLEYESFHLDASEPCVRSAETAIRSLGMEPELLTTNSALDANWMNFHGIPTATLGAGQCSGHTTEECMDIAQFGKACRIALRLATGM